MNDTDTYATFMIFLIKKAIRLQKMLYIDLLRNMLVSLLALVTGGL